MQGINPLITQSSERDIRRSRVRHVRKGLSKQMRADLNVQSDFEDTWLCYCNCYQHSCVLCGDRCLSPSLLQQEIFKILCHHTPSCVDITEYYEAVLPEFSDCIDDLLFSSGSNAAFLLQRYLTLLQSSIIDGLDMFSLYVRGASFLRSRLELLVPQIILQPQMEGNEIEENQQKVTTFSDVNRINIGMTEREKYEVGSTMIPVDLNAFLERPIVIGSFQWASSSPILFPLETYVFPDAFFASTPILNKLLNVTFFRPTFEITVRVNGTPMHYGRLRISWLPQADVLNGAYTDRRALWGSQWIQVTASKQQDTSFIIPFTHYKDRINIGKNVISMFYLYTDVSVPLSSVNGTAPSIGITIFARIIEPRLTGYTYMNDFVAQVGTEVVKKTQSGVISSRVSLFNDFVASFENVPIVGKYASVFSSSLNLAKRNLERFGLSVPINISSVQPMQISMPKWSVYSDNPHTIHLNNDVADSLAKDYSFVNDTEEALSILKFIQRPFCIYTGTLAGTVTAGTNIFALYLCPLTMVYSDYATGFSTTSIAAGPMSFMSRYFSMWRGSMRFHISFVCSRFHAARVRIWYVPYASSTVGVGPGGTLPTEQDATHCINHVIDITEEREYTFSIPYLQMTDWLYVPAGYDIINEGNRYLYTNGYFGIQVINELTSGVSPITSLYYQVFVSAGSDFQYALPTQLNALAKGIFAPQVGEDICEIKASSMRCLLESDYPIMSGAESGHKSEFVSTTSTFNSIKQLTNMVSPLVSLPAQVGNQQLAFSIDGETTIHGADFRFCNYMLSMTTVFRYWRGGGRVTLFTATDSHVSAFPLLGVYSNIVSGSAVVPTYLATAYQPGASQSFTMTQSTARTPFDVTFPYYSIYRCKLTSNHAVPTGLYFGNGVFVLIDLGQAVMYAMSGADDFILGYQMPIPIATTVL